MVNEPKDNVIKFVPKDELIKKQKAEDAVKRAIERVKSLNW